MQWFNDSLVFFKGWKAFAKKTKMTVGDTLVFKYKNEGFKIQMYKCGRSVEAVFQCDKHDR